MIHYRPTEGDVISRPIPYRPKTCFLITQLGEPVNPIIREIRGKLKNQLSGFEYNLIDANSLVTGRDFLMKIWNMIIEVPLGIAVICGGFSLKTYANIFFELGVMQAYGKETLVIKSQDAEVPSDFVRTEYVTYDDQFERRIDSFLQEMSNRAAYYVKMSDLLENDPLLSIDYLRRAFLITRNSELQLLARELFEDAGLNGRARSSVESLLINFCDAC